MGSCQSQENQELAARNKAIEKQINQDKRAGSSIVKLLLLGAGECGKSTVLKQMQILHSNGFTEEEINEKKSIVYNNVVTSMCTILKAMDNVLHIPLEDGEKEVCFLALVNEKKVICHIYWNSKPYNLTRIRLTTRI
ncbi:g-protein alpha subunit [Teladorsagia circumcincta]|uniref:G-protein alpha subunit n=1 Tax=Teladorsagia circumcincta TaxID=45464 RepID=A0A2G9UJN2_TELCI|nr:g-protein alpha subunit [Teladorsagia circumcincta]